MNDATLWKFIGSCLHGTLGASECAPLYELAAIGCFLVLAVILLALLFRRRRADPGGAPGPEFR